MEGACITGQASLDKLRLRELAAIESFAKGKATVQDWRDIADMLNIAETMGLGGIGPEVIPVCAEAQEMLQEAAGRFESTGKMGTTGQGLQAFRELYSYADLQRTSVSRGEYERFIAKTAAKIKTGQGHVVMV